MKVARSFVYLLMALAISAGAARAEDKLDLRLHFRKGDVQQVTVTVHQTVKQTLAGQPQQTVQKIGTTYNFTVSDVDPQGSATVVVRYESVAFHARTPAGPVDYDSTQPPAKVPDMAAGLAGMVGQQFSMKITPLGQVTQVEGLDKMLAAVMQRMNLPEGAARTAVEKAMRQQLSEQNMKSSLQNVFAPFPDHPVGLGDQWTRSVQISIGFPMSLDTTYTLKSRENGMAHIELAGKAATTPDAAIDLGQLKMRYHLSGDQSGELQIAESSGWTRSARVGQKLAGSATLVSPGNPPQDVPIDVSSEMTLDSRDH